MKCICIITQGGKRKTYNVIENEVLIEEHDIKEPYRFHDIDAKAIVEVVGYSIGWVYIIREQEAENVPYQTKEIFVGLILKYVQSIQSKRAYLTTNEFVQGIRLLGWKTKTKFEIIDNYVTNRPTFIHEGEIITFSQFLISLAGSLTEANPMAA